MKSPIASSAFSNTTAKLPSTHFSGIIPSAVAAGVPSVAASAGTTRD